MITIIILHTQHSAIYMMPNRKTVAELMAHWVSDTGQKVAPSSMKFLTLDGYTLTDSTFVEEIPLSDVDTRCVKALSRELSPEAAAEQTALALDTATDDIAAVREQQLDQEKKMTAAGLFVHLHPSGNNAELLTADGDDDLEVQAVAATFSDTALEYKRNIALRMGVPVDSFQLRRGNDELLEDNVSLEKQGISHDTLLIIEKRRTVTVHVVSRSHTRTKQVSVFKDEPVAETLLERNIPLEDQRLCFDGCRLSVSRSTIVLEVFGEDRFMTALPLELAIYLREPVVLSRKHRSRAVSVWPDALVGSLLEVEPEKEPPAPQADQPIADRWAYKAELINDVLFNDDENSDDKSGTLFYNGQELDKTKTFADLAIPPWAVISLDPMNLVFVKEYEFELPMRVSMTASVADVKKLLLKERPALYAEDFQLSGPGRRLMTPANTALVDWGIKDGDRVTIDPIRVPQIVLLSRR